MIFFSPQHSNFVSCFCWGKCRKVSVLARFMTVKQLVAHLVIQICKTRGGSGWLHRNGISDHQQASAVPVKHWLPSTLVQTRHHWLYVYLHGHTKYTTSLAHSIITQVHMKQYSKGLGRKAPRKPPDCAEHHCGSWLSIPAVPDGGAPQMPAVFSGLPQ